MWTVLALVTKEFRQVFRDRNMLRLIFLMPFLQLVILGYAVDTDVRRIHTAVYDFDRSRLSREFVRSMSAGDYFLMSTSDRSVLDLDENFQTNRFNAALVIPRDFGRNLENGNLAPASLIVDGSNANSAGIAMGYAGMIAAQFNRQAAGLAPSISIRQKLLYNSEAESVYYMVPGIVAVLLTMITVMLTSMAIVREREMGTLEQVMVTPISTPAFILGKTIPFAVLGFVEMSLALAVGILWFGIPFAGSWPLLYGLSLVYLFTTLGMGIFVSTITSTQQQAMFFAWFFIIFAIMTSGFFAPIENMPPVVQHMTYANPLRFFMRIVRGIMMKGAGVNTLYRDIAAMVLYSAAIFSLALMRFSKRHR
ncbi:MAG: ABC transporter permease [Candidatus Krumholzibacteria bacterium]|nr:ABC transporter permease [Candidatus Krumholzibacteria bacterium]